MKTLVTLIALTLSFSALSSSCEEALITNEAAIDMFGANTYTASTGWAAYESCFEELDEEGQAIAILIKNRCVRVNDQDGTMYRSFAAQCALGGVQFLQRQL